MTSKIDYGAGTKNENSEQKPTKIIGYVDWVIKAPLKDHERDNFNTETKHFTATTSHKNEILL